MISKSNNEKEDKMAIKKEQMLLRVPEKLKALLKEEAKNRGISLNALIVQRLWRHYKK